MIEFERETAVVTKLIDNGQLKAGFYHFITALESLHGKADSDNLEIIERETKNGIARTFDAFRFEIAEHGEQFHDFAIQFLAELNDKHITEGATPEFVEFINDIKDFTQNLINSN